MKLFILSTIKISLFLMILRLGIMTTKNELAFLLKRPELLLRSLVSMNFFMPVIAVALSGIFNLDTPVTIALIALSLSPAAPVFAEKQIKTGGPSDYVMALFTTNMIISILIIPLSVMILSSVLGTHKIYVPPMEIAKIVFTTMLIPLGLGILVRRFFPEPALRSTKMLMKISNLLLLVGAIPLFIFVSPAFLKVMQRGALAAIIILSSSGFIVGHMLAENNDKYRKVLASATATRHPAIALAVAQVAYPESKATGVVILLYLLVNILTSLVYLRWGNRLTHDLNFPEGAR